LKARLTEQYDLTLTKREMDGLMLAVRTYVREFDAGEEMESMLEALEETYTGPKLGVGVTPDQALIDELNALVSEPSEDDDEEGGSPVVA